VVGFCRKKRKCQKTGEDKSVKLSRQNEETGKSSKTQLVKTGLLNRPKKRMMEWMGAEVCLGLEDQKKKVF
jgi:hypothetical protein